MRDPDNLLQRLLQHKVEFVIVGGYAAVAHGSTLLTMDVDICCNFTVKNLMKLEGAIEDLHPVHRITPKRLPARLTPDLCLRLKNLYLDTDLGQLDCLGSVLGIGDFAVAKQRSVIVMLPFGRCRILSLDALIEAKQAMNRPKDKEAVLQLSAIREKQKGKPSV